LQKEIVAAENRKKNDTLLRTWRPTIVLVSIRLNI